MNWDWDKLQEKRQRQSWRGRSDPNRERSDKNDDDSDDGGGNGPNNGDFNNPLRNVRWRLPKSGGLKYVFLAAAVLWALSGIYIVNPDEEGVVLRFGKYTETTQPGPHYHLPFPIEEVYKPKVAQVQRVEVGFRSFGANGTFQQGQARSMPEEAAMLTGDENVVNIQFSVQYQIKNSVEYLFNVTNQAAVVKNAGEAVMREVIGNSLIDSALADGKLKIQNDAAALLQDLLDRYKVGVRVLNVQMQSVLPPKEVSDAFKDVASAREDKIRLINEAEADRNEMLPKARGMAAEIVNQANAYKESRILDAEGESRRFLAVAAEYNRARDVTRRRLYLEAMEEILSRSGMEKLVLPSGLASEALPLLPLDRMMRSTDAAKPAMGGN
jgi:membrane protease subunit HflK